MEKLIVSPSPHIHSKVRTKNLMLDVVIALLPAVIVSVVFYGLGELLVLAVSVLSCILIEYPGATFLIGILLKPGKLEVGIGTDMPALSIRCMEIILIFSPDF